MRLPNFFVVGAAKAGTTSLYHHLDQHPDIYMSPMKETFYFAPEFRLERLAPELQARGTRNAESLRAYLDSPPLGKRFAGFVEDWSDYCRLFGDADGKAAVGEASPCYLWSPTAAARIAARVPDAKIIMVLRDPIDRAFSQYLSMSNSGDYRCSFPQHIQACLANARKDRISELYPFLEYGLYVQQLQRYRNAFPAAQIGVWLYEDTRGSGFLGDVFDFLGVDRGVAVDTSTRHLEQQMPRAPRLSRMLKRSGLFKGLRGIVPAHMRPWLRRALYRPRGTVGMAPRERSLLAQYYSRDVSRLESMLGRDLSAWLQPAEGDQ